MRRKRGLSVRMKLAFSYAGVIVLTGALLLAVVLVYMLRYVPREPIMITGEPFIDGQPSMTPTYVPSQMDIWVTFAPRAALAMGFLLVLEVAGGWLLAGRMLAPLTHIRAATRTAMDGTLSQASS